MGVIKRISMAAITLILMNSIFAAESYESVLTPGARLLVGDSNQGDFYILGQNDTPQTVASLDLPVQQSNNRQAIAKAKAQPPQEKIEMPASQVASVSNPAERHDAKVNAAPKMKVIRTETIARKLASHINPSPKKISHRWASKKKISKIKVASAIKKQSVSQRKTHIRMTTKKVKHGVASNEKMIKIKNVLHRTTTRLASKTKINHTKLASTKVKYHYAHKKSKAKHAALAG